MGLWKWKNNDEDEIPESDYHCSEDDCKICGKNGRYFVDEEEDDW
jgi:hypothetical protein